MFLKGWFCLNNFFLLVLSLTSSEHVVKLLVQDPELPHDDPHNLVGLQVRVALYQRHGAR